MARHKARHLSTQLVPASLALSVRLPSTRSHSRALGASGASPTSHVSRSPLKWCCMCQFTPCLIPMGIWAITGGNRQGSRGKGKRGPGNIVIPRCPGSWLVHATHAFGIDRSRLRRVCRLELPGIPFAELSAWPAPSRTQCYKEMAQSAPGWMKTPDK